MDKLLNLLILFVLLKSVVCENATVELKFTTEGTTPSDQTQEAVTPSINFWDDPKNPYFAINDADENQEDESTTPSTIVQTFSTFLDDPETMSAILEPENLAQMPALILKFESKLLHGIFEKFSKHPLLRHTLSPGRKTLHNHFIRKRHVFQDQNQEDESGPVVAETISSLLDDPEIVSAILEPENLAQIPALVLKFEAKLLHAIFRKFTNNNLSMKHPLFSGKKLLNSGFKNHFIIKRHIGLWSTFLENLEKRLKNEDLRTIFKRLGDIKAFLKGERDHSDRFNVISRRQKRGIPEIYGFFKRFLIYTNQEETTPESVTFESITPEIATLEPTTPEQTTPEETSPEQTIPEQTTPEITTPEPTTPEITTPETTTPEQTTYKNIEDRLSEILPPQKEKNVLLEVQNEELKNAIRNSINTEESVNNNAPEMKSDVIYIQELPGTLGDNMAAFLKRLEYNALQEWDDKESQEEDNVEGECDLDNEEEEQDEEEEEEDDA